MFARGKGHRHSPFFGATKFGGAFLLMGEAVRLARSAQRSLKSLGENKGTRLVLSLFFKAVLGIERIFHFETLDDPGFAVLTSGTEVISRNTLGGLVRAAPVRGVLRFMRQTAPKVRQAASVSFSIDEHAVARFTRKFDIAKGFHTIRNKKMKVEHLFCAFHLEAKKIVSLMATRGNGKLADIAQKMLPSLRRRARGAQIRVILDAGAAKRNDELLELASHQRQVTLVRVPRRQPYIKAWKNLPVSSWTRLEEPGPYKDAPPKIIHIAETQTLLKNKSTGRDTYVRTVVAREEAKKGKDRWHALWVFGDDQTPAYELIQEFRTRQHHEQRYRILVRDMYVDTAPSGYNKKSRNPKRPGFKQNALTLYGWIAVLAANVMDELTKSLPDCFVHAHPRTLRRWFLNIPAEMYQGDDTFIVLLKPKRLWDVWQSLVERANRRPVRIPWLENRRLILSLQPKKRRSPEVAFDPRKVAECVWC
jgi:hypothetical protein